MTGGCGDFFSHHNALVNSLVSGNRWLIGEGSERRATEDHDGPSAECCNKTRVMSGECRPFYLKNFLDYAMHRN